MGKLEHGPMASVITHSKSAVVVEDDKSDYGSGVDDSTIIDAVADNGSDYGDFDEASALEILSTVESQPLNEVVLESIEDPVVSNEVFEKTADLRIPDLQSSLYTIDELGNKIGTLPSERSPQRKVSVEVEYDLRNREAFSRTYTTSTSIRKAD